MSTLDYNNNEHSSVHVTCSRDFSERIIANDYVLKKEKHEN